MSRSDLHELALLYGVYTAYTDIHGVRKQASEDVLLAVLRLLGAELTGVGDAPRALRRRRAELAARPVEPVSVAWDGGPDGLPLGYHRRQVSVGGKKHETLVISAPSRSWRPNRTDRTWSAFVPLYALRTGRDWGAGDFTDLAELGEWVGRSGGSGVAVLPLNAAWLDTPYEPSPYAPASRLFWNELFVDPSAALELVRSPRAREVLGSEEFRKEVEELRALEHYDPRRLMALKRQVLTDLCRALLREPSDRREDFLGYVEERADLEEYAAFRAAVERRGEPWTRWPAELGPGSLEPGDYDEECRWYHLYAQWLAAQQVATAAARAGKTGAGLDLDLPVGVTADSFDVWRYRELFVTGAGSGAPPDPLGPEGQSWGLAPLHPQAIREDGYRYLRACLKHVMEPASTLRIDHVMGLNRLFWVPEGYSARDGVYVTYPAEELYAVLSLESHLCRCQVIGENLGTVPVYVNQALDRHGIRGMYVAPFVTRPQVSVALPPPPADVQASLNTHDMPPFAAWWRDLDAERRSTLLRFMRNQWEDPGDGEDPGAAWRAMISWLARSPASSVVLSLEDLWAEEEPQNVPGTGHEVPNFRRRTRRTLEELRDDPEVTGLLADLSAKRRTGSIEKWFSYLTEDDLYLFNEGSHFDLADKLGAHEATVDGVVGTAFAVWAPSATRVSVIGNFNGWDRDVHPLKPRGSSGIWEAFLPGLRKGEIYKYFVVGAGGHRVEKADPLGLFHEEPPRTASVVWDLDYEWGDGEWMAGRAERNALDRPISVYEVHLGSWRRVVEAGGSRPMSYRELAETLPGYVSDLGFTHVEFLPVMEHPFGGSWGYQVTGYFAPTSRFGTPQDFMHLVDRLHQAGVGVILDWVPSHFPKDQHGLAYFDGTHLYEHSDPRKGVHPDWDSLIFNYGRHEVRSFLVSAAEHWLRYYHVDGLRTDAVASMLYLDYSREEGEWIPNRYGGRENLEAISLLRRLNEQVYLAFPDTQTIAEESTSWPKVSRPTTEGGLGFGMKWDMGWMHDILDYMSREPVHRKYHHNTLTFRQLYADTENFMLALSHDEVVHMKGSLLGKMPGDEWQRFANLRLLFANMFLQAGKKLLFMGGEFGQWREWSHDESLDWHLLESAPHAGVRDLVRELNRLYREEPALHQSDCQPGGFEWVDCSDAESGVVSFLRKGRDGTAPLLAVFHFTPAPRDGYRVGVPAPGDWEEILNTDDARFGGSGKTHPHPIRAEDVPTSDRPHSIALNLPPLGATLLKNRAYGA